MGWLERLQRVGYVARGLLYATMGVLAIAGATTDQKGSLLFLARTPLGAWLVTALGVAIAAYATWGFIRALFDPWRRGRSAAGLAERLGFAWSGFAYAALALFAF